MADVVFKADPANTGMRMGHVRIEGGRVTVLEAGDRQSASTVFLTHGLAATTRLNWPGAFHALAHHHRVLGFDTRGHGGGITARPFRLDQCADDVVAVADALGIERFTIAGYSMGGPIAMLAARRHPGRVSGLVLCATAAYFPYGGALSRALAWPMSTSLKTMPDALRRRTTGLVMGILARELTYGPDGAAVMRHHDPAALVDAGRELLAFDARPWVEELGVPAASVITTRDRLVLPSRQRALATQLDATIYEVKADHGGAITRRGAFVPVLVEACEDVTGRTRPAAQSG